MIAVLLAILTALIVTYYFYNYNKHWKYVERIPGPKTLPIIGNAHQFGTNPVDNLKNLLKMWRDYDCNTFRAWIGGNVFVILTDPKDVEAVLSSNTILKKSTIYDLLHAWLGEGLLTSSGSKWFKHRKMITPSFHFKILTEFHETMKKNSKKFIQKLSERATSGEIFDIQDLIHYCTLDVICETAMGTEINAMDNHNSDLVKAFQEMCYVVQIRSFNPLKANPFFYRFTKEYQIEKKALNTLKTFTMDVIEKRKKFIQLNANNNNLGNDNEEEKYAKIKQAFLDTLLTATVDGKPLTNQQIYDEVSTFMFEGHDTTTSGITFTIYLLSRHLEAQAKVFQEQKDIFGDDLTKVDPSYQEVQDMKYLELVIKESQRLYPSVPIIARYVTQDTNINGMHVPANTTLTVLIMAMGYNVKYFKDPYKFDPERFNDREKTNPFEYVPFSAGPRNCIGQKFAVLEMKSVISNIIRNFEILPPDDSCLQSGEYEELGTNEYDPLLAAVLTLKSENGVKIRLRHRSQK